MVYFQQCLLGGLRVNHYVNNENNYFCIFLVAIYVNLNVKPLKKCMYCWEPIITHPKLTLLYINYTTNVFVPVVNASLCFLRSYIVASKIYFFWFSCLFFKPISLLRESILFKSLVYFSILHPRFASVL